MAAARAFDFLLRAAPDGKRLLAGFLCRLLLLPLGLSVASRTVRPCSLIFEHALGPPARVFRRLELLLDVALPGVEIASRGRQATRLSTKQDERDHRPQCIAKRAAEYTAPAPQFSLFGPARRTAEHYDDDTQ